MADLASVTATLQRENEEALAASLENASAALQSSGARAAFDELTTILDSQEERTVEEYKKTQQRVTSLQRSIRNLEGLSRAESAALNQTMKDAQNSINQNSNFKSTVGDVVKGAAKGATGALGNLISGALSQSPILAFGASFVGERISQFKERKAAQKAEENQRVERLAVQEQTEQKEMQVLRESISNEDAIRASNKTQEEIQRDAAMSGVSEQEIIDQEKDIIIRKAQASKEAEDAEIAARKNLEKIAERYGISISDEENSQPAPTPNDNIPAPTPNQDIPSTTEEIENTDAQTVRRGRGPDLQPRARRRTSDNENISTPAEGVTTDTAPTQGEFGNDGEVTQLTETQLEFQPFLEKIYDELVWQRENADNPNSLEIEEARELRRERKKRLDIELAQLKAMQEGGRGGAGGAGAGGGGNEGSLLDTIGDIGGGIAALQGLKGAFKLFKKGGFKGLVKGIPALLGLSTALNVVSDVTDVVPDISNTTSTSGNNQQDTGSGRTTKKSKLGRMKNFFSSMATKINPKVLAGTAVAGVGAAVAANQFLSDDSVDNPDKNKNISTAPDEFDGVDRKTSTEQKNMEAPKGTDTGDLQAQETTRQADLDKKRIADTETEKFNRKNNVVELDSAKPKSVPVAANANVKPDTNMPTKSTPSSPKVSAKPRSGGGGLQTAKDLVGQKAASAAAAISNVVKIPDAASSVVETGKNIAQKKMKGILGKNFTKMATKMVPGLGILTGLGFTAGRLWDGDFLGAAAEGAGVFLPSVSGAALDIGLMARDSYNDYYGTDDNPRPLDDDLANNPVQAQARLDEITAMAKDMVLGAEKQVQDFNAQEHKRQVAELEGKIAADKEIAESKDFAWYESNKPRLAKRRMAQNEKKLEELKQNNPAATASPVPAQAPIRPDANSESGLNADAVTSAAVPMATETEQDNVSSVETNSTDLPSNNIKLTDGYTTKPPLGWVNAGGATTADGKVTYEMLQNPPAGFKNSLARTAKKKLILKAKAGSPERVVGMGGGSTQEQSARSQTAAALPGGSSSSGVENVSGNSDRLSKNENATLMNQNALDKSTGNGSSGNNVVIAPKNSTVNTVNNSTTQLSQPKPTVRNSDPSYQKFSRGVGSF